MSDSPFRERIGSLRAGVLFGIAVAVLALVSCGGNQTPSELSRRLAERFAPILYLHSDDPYDPRPVDTMIDHSVLARNSPGLGQQIVDFNPSSDLGHYGDRDLFLDLKVARIYQDPALYSERYGQIRDMYSPTVYARVESIGEHVLLLQYWFFYWFNDWTNRHEGDWEMIALLFPDTSVPQILEREFSPTVAAYSQHGLGRKREWCLVKRKGTHPKVYVAKGSHANYFEPGTHFQIWGADETTEGQVRVPQSLEIAADETVIKYELISISGMAWINFPGHWGERSEIPGFDSPRGPAFQGIKWDSPDQWVEELP